MSINYSIFYTPTFESDIDNIINYNAEDNPTANYAQLRLKGIRILIIDNYIIIYRPDENSKTVSVLRVLSSYQNYKDLL